MQCYKDNHLIAIEEMKKSYYYKMSLEYVMEIIDDGEVYLSEEEDLSGSSLVLNERGVYFGHL